VNVSLRRRTLWRRRRRGRRRSCSSIGDDSALSPNEKWTWKPRTDQKHKDWRLLLLLLLSLSLELIGQIILSFLSN